MDVIITKHAYKRAKERLKWKKSTLNRMAELAYSKGMRHKDTKGRLNKYIYGLWAKFKAANNIRIYGENVYFFNNNILVTLYRLPTVMTKTLRYNKRDEK